MPVAEGRGAAQPANARARTRPASLRVWVQAALLFAALAALGAAVREGRLETVDHFAYRHFEPLRKGDWSLLTTPAGPVAASLLVLAGAARIRRPAGVRTAWLLAFAAGIAIEVAGKRLVERAGVDADRLPWLAHDGYPSGHTMRGILVAGVLASAWPRARRPLVAWAVANAALVAATGMHPLSEVVGGLLAGAALVTCVRAVRRPEGSGQGL